MAYEYEELMRCAIVMANKVVRDLPFVNDKEVMTGTAAEAIFHEMVQDRRRRS